MTCLHMHSNLVKLKRRKEKGNKDLFKEILPTPADFQLRSCSETKVDADM